jgi:hypothetical protein
MNLKRADYAEIFEIGHRWYREGRRGLKEDGFRLMVLAETVVGQLHRPDDDAALHAQLLDALRDEPK